MAGESRGPDYLFTCGFTDTFRATDGDIKIVYWQKDNGDLGFKHFEVNIVVKANVPVEEKVIIVGG
jgi:hypothetical protein